MSSTQTSFKKWYGRNKESYNEARKAKYDSDPSLRRKAYENRLAYEARHHEPVMVDGVLIYNRVAAAQAVGITPTTLSSWLSKNYIIDSRPVGETKHSFTQHQVNLMSELSKVLKTTPKNSANFGVIVEATVNYIKGVWNGSD